MKLTCAVLDDYQGVALSFADWSPIAREVDVIALRDHVTDEDQLAARIAGCEILVVMRERTPMTATLFARLPRLKLLITTGMRNAAIDIAAARRHGVVVCGTGGQGAPTAELTWALILGLSRQLVSEANSLRVNGPWQSSVGRCLHGLRLGLLGLGKIGTRVGRIGAAFGMDVVAWSQNLTAERALQNGARWLARDELLETSDFVSIHLVLGERTRGLIGRAELQRMKPSAYLINTSRAPIVDRSALLESLQQGRIAGAGLDVFDIEPLPATDPFRALGNVLATPHLGYVADINYRVYFREAVEDIAAFLAGTPIRLLA